MNTSAFKRSISILLVVVFILTTVLSLHLTTSATIPSECISTINKDWSIAPITVTDNIYFTDALNYKRTPDPTMSAAATVGGLGGNMTVYNTGDYLNDKVFTYGAEDGTLKTWIDNGGHYRFWIRTPDYNGEKITLRLNFCAYINDKTNANYDYYSYPSINSDIEVVADGKWHEVIGNYNGNTEAQKTAVYSLVKPTAKNGYTLTGEEPKKEKNNFYLRVYNKTTKTITKSDLQYSHIEFHFAAPTALGDGNPVIPDEPISTISKDWSMAPMTVIDNINFTDALNYKRTPDPTMSAAASEGAIGGNMTVYNTAESSDKAFTYGANGTLKSWIDKGGHYRFWIKTPNFDGEKITLRLNFNAYINDKTNENYDYYKYPTVNSDIEVAADGKWHEIIGDFSNNTAAQKADLYALVSPTAKNGYTLTGTEPKREKTDFLLRIYNKTTKVITKGDLQFSHIEFHFKEPTALGDGNPVIPDEPISTISKDWSIAPINVTDNLNFTNALNYKRTPDPTMSAAASEGTLGGNMTVYNTAESTDKAFTYGANGTLRTWINNGGHYRFWIKTPDYNGEKITLRLNFNAYINDKSNENYDYYKYPTVNSDIEVVADGEWHEVIGDFSNNTEAQKADLYALVSPTAKNGYTLSGDELKREKTDFLLRIYNKTTKEITKGDLQFSHIEFHFEAPVALGNGNIVVPDKCISTISKDWSIAPIAVTDNEHFTDALNYQRSPEPTMSAAASGGALGGNMTVYNTAESADKAFSYGADGTLRTWIDKGGHYRFWIKTPDYSGEKIKLRLNFNAYINDKSNENYDYYKYPTVNSDIEVVADGKWHEVIGNYSTANAAQKADLYALVSPTAKNGYTLTGEEPKREKTDFLLRVYNLSAKEITKSDLQFSRIEFHFEEPTTLGDGNIEAPVIQIPSEPISTKVKDWSITYGLVRSNKHFSDILFYARTADTIMSAAAGEGTLGGNMTLYNSAESTDKVFTYDAIGTLRAWIDNGGKYRFWIRTPDYDGEKIALRLNFSAYINDKSNENYDYYSYPSINSDIEVVADGKWHEVIADFGNSTAAQKASLYSLVSPTAKNGYVLTGEELKREKNNFYIRIYNKSTKDITKSDFQFSHFEFHFEEPIALGDGHIEGEDELFYGAMPPSWSELPQMKADEENTILVKTAHDFWTGDWNKSERSVIAPNLGLTTKDPKYSWFRNYRQIEITDEEKYYADGNKSELCFYLTSNTDISGYLKTGALRFWIKVPKDMTVRLYLLSIAPDENNPESKKYTQVYIDVPLTMTTENDGYQEVQIALKDFYNKIAIKNQWNPYYVSQIKIGGIEGCTPETFLAKGEQLCVSHFEIWKAEAKEPEEIDTTRKFYSKNGKFFIRDTDEVLSTTSTVSAFENILETEKYSALSKKYFDNAEFLSSFTVEVVSETLYDCYIVKPYDKVEVNFPLSKYVENKDLNICVVNGAGIYDCEYTINDTNLVILTDQFGEFLFMSGGLRNVTEFESSDYTGNVKHNNSSDMPSVDSSTNTSVGGTVSGNNNTEVSSNEENSSNDSSSGDKTVIKKYKKYKKKKPTDAPAVNMTAIVLISCSALVVVGGTTTTLIILKKKGLILKKGRKENE